jgi:hypothetical protein
MRVRVAELGNSTKLVEDVAPRTPLIEVLRRAGIEPGELPRGVEVRLGGVKVADFDQPVEPGASILLLQRVAGAR